MLEIDDLLLEREAIEKEIKDRADEELATLEKRKAHLLAITGKAATVAQVAQVAPAVQVRKTQSAKYRYPSGETWSGRGPKPAWMKNWIAIGKDPNDLLIAA